MSDMSDQAGFQLQAALRELSEALKNEQESERKRRLEQLAQDFLRARRAEVKQALLEELSLIVSPVLLKFISDLRAEDLKEFTLAPDSDPDVQTILTVVLDRKE